MVACENNVKYLGFSFLKIVLALQPQPIHLLVLPSLICPCSQLLFWCRFVAKTTCGQVRDLMGFLNSTSSQALGKKTPSRNLAWWKGQNPSPTTSRISPSMFKDLGQRVARSWHTRGNRLLSSGTTLVQHFVSSKLGWPLTRKKGFRDTLLWTSL